MVWLVQYVYLYTNSLLGDILKCNTSHYSYIAYENIYL